MTLTELKYIVSLSRTLHFGDAAKECLVSQPTLSIAVKKLEEQLGVNIFERSRQSLMVTPVGEKIIAQAEKVLSESSVIQQIALADKDPLTSVFKLGAIYTVLEFAVVCLLSSPTFSRIAASKCASVRTSVTGFHKKKASRKALLSFLLFIVQMDGLKCFLPQNSRDVLASLYVDDLAISVQSRNLATAEKTLQNIINNVNRWAVSNGMKFSSTKSVCVDFNNKRGIHPDQIGRASCRERV